jgi:hypothetical protein
MGRKDVEHQLGVRGPEGTDDDSWPIGAEAHDHLPSNPTATIGLTTASSHCPFVVRAALTARLLLNSLGGPKQEFQVRRYRRARQLGIRACRQSAFGPSDASPSAIR